MTEAEWLACEDPTEMLLFIKQRRAMRKPVKQRKQRLFAVACCRRILHLIGDDRGGHCIDVAERVADGAATSEEKQLAEKDANAISLKSAANDAAFACNQLFWKDVNGLHVSTSAMSAAYKHQETEANRPFEPLAGRRHGACPSEARAQVHLLRDIFGNPFRPVTLDPAWLTSDALALARGIYDDRAFDRMPILADALQDAGCDRAEVLDHCRNDGPHARGCWVVDLVLGKE